MKKRTKITVAGIAALAVAAGGVGVATAGGGGDDSEARISGSAVDRASAVALEHTGGGRVTDTEAGDEVEVTRADGSQVDVQLDRGFEVVGDEAERAGEDED